MALKTKTMTANEASQLSRVHNEMADAFAGNTSGVETMVRAVGTGLIGKFLGSVTGGVAAVAQVLIDLAENDNREASRYYLRGAAKAFNEIEDAIRNGGHSSATVQQVWISYAFGGGGPELVQGDNDNPSQAYKIISFN